MLRIFFFLKPPTFLHGCQYQEIQLASVQYSPCPKWKSGWKESGTELWQLKTVSGDHPAAASSSHISRGHVYFLKINPIPPSLHMCRGGCLPGWSHGCFGPKVAEAACFTAGPEDQKNSSRYFFRSWSEFKKNMLKDKLGFRVLLMVSLWWKIKVIWTNLELYLCYTARISFWNNHKTEFTISIISGLRVTVTTLLLLLNHHMCFMFQSILISFPWPF